MNQLKNYLSSFYRNHQDFANVLSLVLITVLVFYNSLGSYFVAFDDFNWPSFYNRSITTILLTSSTGVVSEGNYRPIEVLSHKFDKFAYGSENTFWRHLTNLIIHIFNVIFVYVITFNLSKKRFAGLIAGLIFSIHLIHSYSYTAVSWITGRVDPIVTFFYLLSLILFKIFLESRYKLSYLFSIITFFLALLTKEMAVTLPIIILIYLILFYPSHDGKSISYLDKFFPFYGLTIIGGIILVIMGVALSPNLIASFLSSDGIIEQSNIKKINYFRLALIAVGGFLTLMLSSIYFLAKRSERASYLLSQFSEKVTKYYFHVRYAIPYFLTLFIYLLIRVYALGGVGGNYENASFNFGIDSFTRDIYALAGLIYPVGIEYNNHIFYLQLEHSFIFYAAAIIVIMILIFALYMLIKTQSKVLIFCFLWIFITLIPVHNIILPLHQFQQRYLYLPLVGFCLFISILIIQNKDLIFARFSKALSIGFLILFLFLCSVLLYNHNAKIMRSGSIMYRFQKDMHSYRYLDLENANLYFITFPMDPMNSTSAVFIAAGYMNRILQFDNKNYKEQFQCNILMHKQEDESTPNIRWQHERNFTVDGIDPTKYFVIPQEMSATDKKRKMLYGRIPHPLIVSLSSADEIIKCRINNEDTTSVAILKILKTDNELKKARLEVELKNSQILPTKKSLFFIYEKGHFKLVKEFKPETGG